MLEQTPQRSETPPPIDTWDRHAVMRKVASLPKKTVLTNCLERLGSGTLENYIKKYIKKNNIEKFTKIYPNIPHNKVLEIMLKNHF